MLIESFDLDLTPAQSTIFDYSPAARVPALITPLKPFRIVYDEQTYRYRIVVAGRRFGKTREALSELITCAIATPRGNYWYLAPTRIQAKDIAWEELKRMVPSFLRYGAPLESELTLRLRNGARISLHGAENYNMLLGRGLNGVVLDEFADMAPEVWRVIRPQLSDVGREGWVLFIGTPRGFNHFKELYDRAVAGRKGWWAKRFTSVEGGNISPDEIEELRESMPDRDFRQEIMATFESVEGRVYHSFARELYKRGNLDQSVHDRGGAIMVGMDFNVNPMSATLSSRVTMNRGGRILEELHTWGEKTIPNANTETMMAALRQEFGDRTLVVYPDPTGRQRHTNAAIGRTDFSIIRSYGATIYAPTTPYSLRDKYNTVNALLCNEKGDRRLLINPANCTVLLNGFDGLVYKKGTNLPDKDSGHDHITDAEAYKVCGLFPLKTTQTVVSEMF